MITCLGKRKNGQPCSKRCVRFCHWHTTDTICSVCMEQPIEPVSLNCEHIFCKSCIYRWMFTQNEPTCPMCRSTIVQPTRMESIEWGLSNNILDKTNVYLYRLTPFNYLKFIQIAGIFESKLLTKSQLNILASKLPVDLFINVKITREDFYIYKNKIPLQDFYIIC